MSSHKGSKSYSLSSLGVSGGSSNTKSGSLYLHRNDNKCIVQTREVITCKECSQSCSWVHSIGNQYDPYDNPDHNLDMTVGHMIDSYKRPNILLLSYMKIPLLLTKVRQGEIILKVASFLQEK